MEKRDIQNAMSHSFKSFGDSMKQSMSELVPADKKAPNLSIDEQRLEQRLNDSESIQDLYSILKEQLTPEQVSELASSEEIQEIMKEHKS
jgi:hypothetical protein